MFGEKSDTEYLNPKTLPPAGLERVLGLQYGSRTVRIFVCHASEDARAAQEIALALRGAKFDVFIDEHDLPVAGDFHARIREAIRVADAFIFLITEHSLAPNKYTLSELGFAKEKWPHPGGRLFAVLLTSIPISSLDPYLRSVTILEPRGNVAADVCRVLVAERSKRHRKWRLTAAVAVAALLISGLWLWLGRASSETISFRLTAGQTRSIPFDLHSATRLVVVLDQLTPDWHKFTGTKGLPGQDGVFVSICSANTDVGCREGQIGEKQTLSFSLPDGPGYVRVRNFDANPELSLTFTLRR